MTQEELTQMAILKAKALANETPKAPKVHKVSEIIKDVEILKEEKINPETGAAQIDYKHSVILGNDKEIKFNNWTGKTKKIFKQMVENDSANLDDAIELLVRNHINTKDIYLSDVEQQYLLLKLREVSLSENFEYDAQCPNCSEVQTIKSTIDEIFKLKPASYPKYDEDLKLTFIDIKNQNDLEDKVKKIQSAQNYDGITTKADIEIAMHIETSEAKSPNEILDIIDTLDLKTLNGILDKLSETAPSLESYTERICKNCKKTVKFYTDEIPDVFTELL